MKNTWKKTVAFVLALALVAGATPVNVGGFLTGGTGIVASAYTEELLTVITPMGVGGLTPNYSVADRAVLTFSGTICNDGDPWGWYGYPDGGSMTVTPAEGYVITRITFTVDRPTDATCELTQAPFTLYVGVDYGNYYTSSGEGNTGTNFGKYGPNSITVYGYKENTQTDISDATVNLASDNTVASITVGDDTITNLTDFDITYGTDDSHTATAVPTDAGTYYAYVTANDTNTAYTGTAKSSAFTVTASEPTITSASVTLNDGFALNFYVDGVNSTTMSEYTVKFAGNCDENGTQVELNENDGKFYATANLNAKDINENITATLCKNGTATDTTLTYSVNSYLTAALAIEGLDDKTKDMLLTTQIYGYAADEYFNNANNNASAMISDYLVANNMTPQQLMAALAPYQTESNALGTNKVSMVLNSKVKLRVYSENGSTGENSHGKYTEVADLTPLTMGQAQDIDGYSVSGYTWVYRVLTNNESSEKNTNMANALFVYMKAAEALNTVDVASVTITNAPTQAITVGNTGTFTATVLPENATNKTVTWSSDNADVLTVNATTGEYEAKSAGMATITANAGGKTATCAVTVKAAVPLSDAFNNGSVITLYFQELYGICSAEFKNNNGNFQTEGYTGWFCEGAKMEKLSDTTFKISLDGKSGDFSNSRYINTFTFDTVDNTYSYQCGGYSDTPFSSIKINGEEVAVTAK